MTYKVKGGMEEEYREYVRKNQDSYSSGVVHFSERWALMMEGAIRVGRLLKEIADELSHQADTEGITGFMYGCAVKELSHFWVHGEELRRWHNLKTQIGNEGEKANKSSGVLNPALLSINVGGG